MELNSDVYSTSEDESIKEEKELKHTAVVKLDLDSSRAAEIICRTLSVDKEPNRSSAKRDLRIENSCLIVKIASVDRRSLQKSLANLFDMCDLAKATIDLVDEKKWLENREPNTKKQKLQ